MACNPFTDPVGCINDATSTLVGSAIDDMARAVADAFGNAVASLGTVWVNVGTPDLTGSGGDSSVVAGAAAPAAGNITTVLGYVMWISLIVAVVALMLLGGLVAVRQRTGDGIAAVGRVGLVLAAVVLVAGSSALVAGLLPSGPSGAGGTVAFLQSSLWWYMGAAAVLATIVGGARMAWEQRAEPGKETLRALLTLVVVAGAGVTIINLLVVAADSFSVWILNNALVCDVTAAEGTYVQDVDIEVDPNFLPSFVSGERVIALVTGSVRATVDFSGLAEDSITVDEESNTIRITIPEPTLSDADIDALINFYASYR